eukprot:184836_1
MSWASIVSDKSRNERCRSTSLKVQYSFTPNEPTQIEIDDIPRHKEISPDPADDFVMTNNIYKVPHKVKMTPSLKKFILWVDSIETKSKPIYIDFNQIDKDLKYQCSLYQNRHNYLRKIYYYYGRNEMQFFYINWESWYDYKKPNSENQKYFHGHNTIIHWIINKSVPSKWNEIQKKLNNKDATMEVIKYGAMIIKLLMKNKIITGKQMFWTSEHAINFDSSRSIYDEIKKELFIIPHLKCFDLIDYKQQCLDIYFDLLLFCLNNSSEINNAMVDIRLDTSSRNSGSRNEFSHVFHSTTLIPSDLNLFQRLLFHCIPIFCITIDDNIDFSVEHFRAVISHFYEPKYKTTRCIQQYMITQRGLTAPLIILSFLKQVKNIMSNVISQSNNYILTKEISNIIASYLFYANPSQLYDNKEWLESVDVKANEFMNYIRLFPMIMNINATNTLFDEIFNTRFNNEKFAKHIMNEPNYFYSICSTFCNSTYIDLEYLYKLVVLHAPP